MNPKGKQSREIEDQCRQFDPTLQTPKYRPPKITHKERKEKQKQREAEIDKFWSELVLSPCGRFYMLHKPTTQQNPHLAN